MVGFRPKNVARAGTVDETFPLQPHYHHLESEQRRDMFESPIEV